MNILYIAHQVELEGATRSLLGLIDQMIQKGHTIYVMVPQKRGNLIHELGKRNLIIIYGRYYSWMSSTLNTVAKIKALIKLFLNILFVCFIAKKLKNLNIDLIHTNSLVINIGGVLRNKINVPHIWHIREFGEEDHIGYFSFDKLRSLHFVNTHSDSVIVISKALMKKYEQFINKDKLNLIYNGISKDYLQKKGFISGNTVNLLISGSLHEGKGQDEAILAIKSLVDKGHKNIILNIAGKGKPAYTQKLQKIVLDNNLEHYVVFHGYISNIKLLRKSMDIELVCSKSEAFGRVTIEAMMSMNPVIASDTGANPELVIENFNGLLYRQGNHHDLAGKIEILIHKRELIQQYGKNAYTYAKSKYIAENNADNIEILYQKLLKRDQ